MPQTSMFPAGPKDLESLYSIILDRAVWLKSKNIPQWDPVYPKARFEKEVQDNQVYYFLDGGEVIGTVTLLDARPSYYPDGLWGDSRAVWYVCRLAVPSKFSGKGYGKSILALIEKEATKKGKKSLRLDVVKANPFLRYYYEKQGFDLVKEADSHGTPSLFMEKNLA